MHSACIIDLGLVAKLIAKRISPFRRFVIQINSGDPEAPQGVQLVCFRDTVVVCILPERQLREDRIATVNPVVSVTAIIGLIVFRQRQESVCLKSTLALLCN
jgi:hypothetical protein